LFDEGGVLEFGVLFDVLEGDGVVEFLVWGEFYDDSVGIIGRRILVCLVGDLCDADDFFAYVAMVSETEVSSFHGPQIVSRLIIADAISDSFAVLDKLVSRVLVWFGFDESISHDNGEL